MTFYAERAETVTDLLTRYGQTITLTRTSGAFDPVAGKNESSTTTNPTTIGIWQTIHARLIDGTRVRSGDKFLLIDGSVAPRMSDKIDGWSVVEIYEINPAGTVLAYRLQVRK